MGAVEIVGVAAVAGFGGGLMGAVAGLRRHRRLSDDDLDFDDADDEFDEEYPVEAADAVAREWSERAGEPDATELIGRRLRIGWEAQQRRARRQGER